MYLLTAAADLVVEDEKSECQKLTQAINRLWPNMVDCKMYSTGGIGAMPQWEGFGIDHFLPQGTDEGGCYAETCASIGVMMLAERLLKVRRTIWSYLSWTSTDDRCGSSISTPNTQT